LRRFLVLIAAGLLGVLSIPTTALATGAIDTSDSAMLQRVTPAVVDLSLWKLRPSPKAGGEPRRVRTHGSGFIVDPAGIIVTNKHVTENAEDITVIFRNGERTGGKLIAVAPMVDLALVKVEFDRPLPTLRWGDSTSLRIGDHVFAIGNPLGLGTSVSSGIVSALNRDLQDTPFDHYLQIDAAINHGNSGGPLVDVHGEVVGVDTALYNPVEEGGFIGIGFAIPSDSARFVVNRLLDKRNRSGWLGVRLQDLTYELSVALGLKNTDGAIVAAVDEQGPAKAARLHPSDVLLAINDSRFSDARAFMREIIEMPVGQPVKLTIWRAAKELVVTSTIAQWPNSALPAVAPNTIMASTADKAQNDGLTLATLTPESRNNYKIDDKVHGALVVSVDKDSEAHDLGIVPGDVLTFVQDTAVAAPDDVQAALSKAYEQRLPFVAVLVQGKSGIRWVSFGVDER
jgi:serine protease Do